MINGEHRDLTQAQGLIHEICPTGVFADKADNADGLIFNIADKNTMVIFPQKLNFQEQRAFD